MLSSQTSQDLPNPQLSAPPDEEGANTELVEEVELLLDPLIAEIRIQLEEHNTIILGQIASRVSTALSNRSAQVAKFGNSTLSSSDGQLLDRNLPRTTYGRLESKAPLAVTNALWDPTLPQMVHKQEVEQLNVKTDGILGSKSTISVEEEDLQHRELAGIVGARDRFQHLKFRKFVQPSWWKARASFIVNSRNFGIGVGFLILLNSVFIGVEVEVYKDTVDHNKNDLFIIVQAFFCLTFFWELILRLIAEGFAKFFTTSQDLVWNYMDLCIVVSSVTELIIYLALFSSDSAGSNLRNISNIRIMRILRVTRLLRALRAARVVRFVRALRVLVTSIFCTLCTIGWSMLLLTMIIYIFAILLTEEAADLFQMERLREVPEGQFSDVRRFFGSLSESMFTLFKSIAGGLDWDEPARALAKINSLSVYLFTIFIAFVLFAVLNVVSGVFCAVAIESNLKDQENAVHMHIQNKKKWQKDLSRLFNSFDQDGSNVITISELEMGLKDERIKAYLSSLELDPEDAWTLFKLLDADKTQSVNIEEFVMGCLRLKGQAKSIDMAKLMYDFKMMAKHQEDFMEFVVIQLERLAGNSGSVVGHLQCNAVYQSNDDKSTQKKVLL